MTPRRLSAIPESPWWLDLCAAGACLYVALLRLDTHPTAAVVAAWFSGACFLTATVKVLEDRHAD